ncbi:DUF410-domain-containing protein [Delitschia confertaspora ATCC 74209]|uniref:DUF410-domain-containing protein n=1 Tax=Delitschia confertaspora ATCC 74209 TaxID=1513339 RepID=A0A9P4JSX0_9PLEO|nr:DUF410-domain-containing protein [Delitschia confertaspora ATCC 74209]
MASKIEKTIQRQQEKIANGEYYEAHQQLRVISARYTKQNNPSAAADILYSGALSLLKAGQGGSGADLSLLLLDVWTKAEVKPDADTKGKVLGLLRAFPKGEPTRKRVIGEAIGWSAKLGEYPAGDPELHHVAGTLYAEDLEPYDTERHLLLGNLSSASTLASLEYSWYTADAPHTAPLYAARGVLPYLITGNLRAANKFQLHFTTSLQTNTPITTTPISTSSSELRVYPSLPLLNFLSLLLLAVERGANSVDMFRMLKSHYREQLNDKEGGAGGMWDEALEQIGEMYFGIRAPRQGNPMMDMLGSMFGGGGFGGGSKGKGTKAIPAAEGLD